LSADVRFPKLVGLRVGRKTPLFNGPLECRLYSIDIVAGSARTRHAIAKDLDS
jgi:putative N6-adenine-specific DNA methylase